MRHRSSPFSIHFGYSPFAARSSTICPTISISDIVSGFDRFAPPSDLHGGCDAQTKEDVLDCRWCLVRNYAAARLGYGFAKSSGKAAATYRTTRGWKNGIRLDRPIASRSTLSWKTEQGNRRFFMVSSRAARDETGDVLAGQLAA